MYRTIYKNLWKHLMGRYHIAISWFSCIYVKNLSTLFQPSW
uniref:Uncharacterized protein n=1 Tax=Rhizophora mucronata TaxID=61149 RepID=A0A2P2QTB0_RHIMU